jgi:hypothetical protein
MLEPKPGGVRRLAVGSRIRPAAVTPEPDPIPAAAPARLEALFHAPEVECIGKGKVSVPYEFGVKVSIVTTNARAPGGPPVERLS